MSVILDRVNSDVPLGLIRSDYIYKSDCLNLSEEEPSTKPHPNRKVGTGFTVS